MKRTRERERQEYRVVEGEQKRKGGMKRTKRTKKEKEVEDKEGKLKEGR
jgi:hypothetical protein